METVTAMGKAVTGTAKINSFQTVTEEPLLSIIY